MWFAVLIMLFHWVSDFLLQNTSMATNKSKSNYWLTMHVLYYVLGMSPLVIICGFINGTFALGLIWLLINGVLHYMTDYCTSRWTSKLYEKKIFYGFPSFFSVIGLDQWIHTFCLLITFEYIILFNT